MIKRIKKVIPIVIMLVICMCTSIVNASFSIEKASLYKGDRCKYLFKNRANGGLIGAVKVFYNKSRTIWSRRS